MKTDEVENFNTDNVVFRGSGSGLIVSNYSKASQKRSHKLKPEQIDGDITVSDYSVPGKSGVTRSSQETTGQSSRYTQQTIYD
jgi:hypothetical protein